MSTYYIKGRRMKRFHHIGLPAPDQQTPMPGESFVSATRTWVTNPARHPQRVEWLRYEPDTTVGRAFQSAPHICYEVDDLADYEHAANIVAGPFEVGDPPFGRAVFIQEDGIAVEYLQIYPGRQWFDDDLEQGAGPREATDPGDEEDVRNG
jgi:hypothetical protein